MTHSNWFYVIVESILDARDGAEEPTQRRWQSPLSKRSIARDLVGLNTPYDSLEQTVARGVLHRIFRRR